MGKVCSKCKVEKDLTEFGKYSASKDGLRHECKPCRKSYYQNNKEKWVYDYDPETYDPQKRHESYLKHMEREKAYSKKYNREFYRKNPHIKLHSNLLTITMNKLNTPKSKSTIEELGYSADELYIHLKSLGWEKGDHTDHKIPMSWFREGTPSHIVNHLQNLQPLKPEVNISKGNRYAIL